VHIPASPFIYVFSPRIPPDNTLNPAPGSHKSLWHISRALQW